MMTLEQIKAACAEMEKLDPSKRVTMNDMARACEFAPKAAAALKLAIEALELIAESVEYKEFCKCAQCEAVRKCLAIQEAFR